MAWKDNEVDHQRLNFGSFFKNVFLNIKDNNEIIFKNLHSKDHMSRH